MPCISVAPRRWRLQPALRRRRHHRCRPPPPPPWRRRCWRLNCIVREMPNPTWPPCLICRDEVTRTVCRRFQHDRESPSSSSSVIRRTTTTTTKLEPDEDLLQNGTIKQEPSSGPLLSHLGGTSVSSWRGSSPRGDEKEPNKGMTNGERVTTSHKKFKKAGSRRRRKRRKRRRRCRRWKYKVYRHCPRFRSGRRRRSPSADQPRWWKRATTNPVDIHLCEHKCETTSSSS